MLVNSVINTSINEKKSVVLSSVILNSNFSHKTPRVKNSSKKLIGKIAVINWIYLTTQLIFKSLLTQISKPNCVFIIEYTPGKINVMILYVFKTFLLNTI